MSIASLVPRSDRFDVAAAPTTPVAAKTAVQPDDLLSIVNAPTSSVSPPALNTPADAAAFMSSQTMPSGWFTSSDPAYQKALAAGAYSQPQDFYLEGSTTNPYYVADPFGAGWSASGLAKLSPEEKEGNIFAKYGAADVAYNPQYGWIGVDAQGKPIKEAFVSNADPDKGFLKQVAGMALSIAAPYLGPWAQGAMAAYNASQGNYLGALGTFAPVGGELAGSGGEFLGASKEAWQNIGTGANVAKAVKDQDLLALAAAASKTDTGKEMLGTPIGDTGVTGEQALKTVGVLNNVNQGNYAGALAGLGDLTKSKDLSIASNALALQRAIGSNNPVAVMNAAKNFANVTGNTKTATDTGGVAQTASPYGSIFDRFAQTTDLNAILKLLGGNNG